jgi:molybdopterin-guanine dinucleotide biosynthesis protein A
MLAAMHWAPAVSWLFVACDLPLITTEAVEWLLATRAPGVWATLPRLAGKSRVEPLFAHYDFRAGSLLEHASAPRDLADREHILHPTIPAPHAAAWRNMNSPADLEALAREK